MNISMQYFLTVVEFKSISRAAEHLYVSQQNLSNHIKRLEKEYGVLFARKPKFMLTPSGEALVETLNQIRFLESGLKAKLQDIQDNTVGLVRMGLHTARARILLPTAIAEFQHKFPHVRLEIIHADTAVYENMLENGDIDLFLGIDTNYFRDFTYSHLVDEPAYLLATRTLLDTYGCDQSDTCRITKKELCSLPLIFSPQISNLQSKIQQFMQKNKLALTPQIVVGDFAIQLQLARENLGACFCPQMFLSGERRYLPKEAEPLHTCTVEGLSISNRLSIVLNKKMYRPHYMDELVEILRNNVTACFEKI